MERTIFLNIFLLITTAFASAQVSPSIRYTINDGLPSNNTRAVFKDSRDVLWIGTDAGLCTYDGRTFTRYPLPNDLPSQKVWAIEEDPDGNLWFGTFGGGLLKYDGREFTRFTTPEITSNEIRVLKYSERFDCLLVGTQFGFSVISEKGILSYDKDSIKDNRFPVMSFMEDNDGVIIHTFSDHTYHFNPVKQEVKPLSKESHASVFSSSASYITSWGDTIIGLGKYGLRVISKNGVRNFDNLGQVFGIQEDKNGLIWIAAWSFFDMTEPGGIYSWDGTQLRYANPDWSIEGRLMWNFFYDEATQTLLLGNSLSPC